MHVSARWSPVQGAIQAARACESSVLVLLSANKRIQLSVKLTAFVMAISLSALAFAGTPGMFRGVVGEVADRGPNWIYVEGHNGTIRVVEISLAKVTYDPKFPQGRRRKVAANSLGRGAEVRVTAELEDNGDWHASEIEIIRPASTDTAQNH
jgi:hypothetical protein